MLKSALGAAQSGHGQLVIVRGPAGIGKTALVNGARGLARERGMLVLSARGEEIERDFAFGVARQLLTRPAQDRLDCEGLNGASRLAAAALAIGPQNHARAPAYDPSSSRHGLFWLVSDLAAEHPALLTVDDVQWADAASRQWLAFLARRVDDLPLALILAVRDEGEPDSGLASLQADPSARSIRPRALTPIAVRHLVAAALGEDAAAELAEEVYRATKGNPLWVSELLRPLTSDGRTHGDRERIRAELASGSLTHAVLGRLRQLAEGAVPLAAAVAILGANVEATDAAALAGLSGVIADRAVSALIDAGLLIDEHGRLSFSHPLVHEAVSADLSTHRRATFHQKAARVLSARGANPELVAAHLLHAPRGCAEGVVPCLREAANLALARGAPEVAIAYLDRALEEAGEERPLVLRELGNAEVRLSRPASAEHLLSAYGSAPAKARPCIAIEAAHSLLIQLRVDEAVELLDEALKSAPHDQRECRLRVEAELIAARVLHGEPSELPDRLPNGETAGERALLSTMSLARLTAAEPMDEARRMARAAWADGRLLSEEGPESTSVHAACTAPVWSDSYDEAIQRFDEVISAARCRGSVGPYVLALAFKAYSRFRAGDIGEAVADARLAMAAEAEQPSSLVTPVAISSLIEPMIEFGGLEEADQALRSRRLDGPLPSIFMFDVLLDRRGRLRIAQGRLEDGVTDLLEAGRRLAWRPNPVENWRSYVAPALLELGRGEEARSLVATELELARRVESPRQIALAERAAALLEQPVDLEGLRRSAQRAQPAGARLEEARAVIDLGAALRRGGERVRARSFLHEGFDLASRCRAAVLADRAREELHAAGGRIRGTPLGSGSLTPCERRVARMAAEGRSNREIAQALFVTQRTIETHLSHAYTKLEITARGELAEALTSDTASASERPARRKHFGPGL